MSIEIRPAQTTDAIGIHDFLSETLRKESRNIISLPEELILSPQQQIAWIDDYNQDADALLIVASEGGKIIGVLDFKAKKKKRLAHSGEFGISVRPGYQNQKIGQRMLHFFIQWAQQNPRLKKIILCVFASNERAIYVYHKMGFVIEGKQKDAVRMFEGAFEDVIYMALEV